MKKYFFIVMTAIILLMAPAAMGQLAENCGVPSLNASAEMYSGDCGEKMMWTLDTESGILNITGSGEMKFTQVHWSSTDDEDESDEDEVYTRYIAPWNKYGSYVKTVNIENGITSVYEYAFENCTKLKNINIPDSVIRVGMSAFDDTAYYKNSSNWKDNVLYIDNVLVKSRKSFSGELKIRKGTVCIADYACHDCNNVTDVTVPEGVIRIGADAFSRCSRLKNVTLPDSLLYVERMAFAYCSRLKSMVFPKNVKYVSEEAFWKTSVTSLYFMNPSCKLKYEYESPMLENYTTLYGYKGSPVEKYADIFDLEFVEVKEDHIWKVTSVIKKASCTTSGKSSYVCTLCGKTKTSVVPAIGKSELKYKYYTYKGYAVEPDVTVSDAKGNKLVKGTDYTVKYSDNKSIGKASVKVTFKGKYSGSETLNFRIRPADVTGLNFTSTTHSVRLSWAPVKGATTYRIYKYSATRNRYTQVASTSDTVYTFNKLSAGTVYTYYVKASKNIGKTTYICKDYAGVKTATKTLAPKSPTLTAGTAKLTAKWIKVTGAAGYQLAYATSKNGIYKTVETKKLSCTIKELTKGTTYYVKVRTYKSVDGVKVYSAYSAPKTVKVK